jgi:hypothetical protein
MEQPCAATSWVVQCEAHDDAGPLVIHAIIGKRKAIE